ncbi:M56 family metallopeptidase [Paraglaciecola sp.]|uniref:M56 family metallopeptidase n=1 Tax=Paraglaciecola sp. TaxID=1920173 RepID=UPI0032648891
MINWLWEQQAVICFTLLLLIIAEAKAIKTLGANTVYSLWLILPLCLIANNLPQDIVAIDDNSMYRYLVELDGTNTKVNLDVNWAWIWAIGMSIILCLGGISQWKIQRLPKTKSDPSSFNINLPKALSVHTNTQLSGPILSGLIRPMLLIPEGFRVKFTPNQQQLMLTHELVHYQRKDNFYNLLALIFVAVFWFNPLSWLAYRAFRRNQELACDETVLKDRKIEDKISYSKALLFCAEHSRHSFSIYSPYGEKNSMQKRIKNIQHTSVAKPALVGLVIALSSILIGGVAFANIADSSHSVRKLYTAQPVIRIEPKYPVEAARNGVEGHVIFGFDIAKDGSTDNIKVLESIPEGMFDKVAMHALNQWVYKPRIQGGKAQRQTNLKVQLDFRMGPPDTKKKTVKNSKPRLDAKAIQTAQLEKVRVQSK